MSTLRLALATLILAVSCAAQQRQTIYVDRMDGWEAIVEKALQEAELPFDFIEEIHQPEMKATLAKTQAAYGEILYRRKFGRNETHRLELRDAATNKVIAWHAFRFSSDEASRRREAGEFASKVKKAWVKKRR